MKDFRINHMLMLEIAEIFKQKRKNPRILDFGCGDGIIVKEGRKRGLDIYGADIFYGNEEKIRSEIVLLGYSPKIIGEIKNGRIIFEDQFFDLVICNQVFEHVQEYNLTLTEINRILKPNGYLFCIFPPKEAIIEWHIGIPFIHWFPKRSMLRFILLSFFRKLGFGFNKDNLTKKQWVFKKLRYLEEFTYYRSIRNIKNSFSQLFDFKILKYNSFNSDIEIYGELRKFSKIIKNPLFSHFLALFQNFWNLILILSKNKMK